MDVKQMLYMVTIAQEGGISKAAAKLFITQSALDQQLLKLEHELGTPLFFRSRTSFSLTEESTAWTVARTAIGQGETVVTPLHMAMIVQSIANDGVLMKPYVLDHVENHSGGTVDSYSPKSYGTLMTADEAETITEYMKAVVEDGTGRKLNDLGFSIAGKTGTAEYSSDKSKSHAWFVGFSDTGDSDIVVCVLVEEKGSGSEYAVPVARQVFSAWYAQENSLW